MIESKIIQTICFPSRFRRDGLTIVEQNNRYYCEPRKSCSPVRVPSPVSRPVTKMFVIYIKCLVFLECQSNFDSSYTGFDGKIKNKRFSYHLDSIEWLFISFRHPHPLASSSSCK